jgi:hypothetical protein
VITHGTFDSGRGRGGRGEVRTKKKREKEKMKQKKTVKKRQNSDINKRYKGIIQ